MDESISAIGQTKENSDAFLLKYLDDAIAYVRSYKKEKKGMRGDSVPFIVRQFCEYQNIRDTSKIELLKFKVTESLTRKRTPRKKPTPNISSWSRERNLPQNGYAPDN